jgi:ribosomal protein L18
MLGRVRGSTTARWAKAVLEHTSKRKRSQVIKSNTRSYFQAINAPTKADAALKDHKTDLKCQKLALKNPENAKIHFNLGVLNK